MGWVMKKVVKISHLLNFVERQFIKIGKEKRKDSVRIVAETLGGISIKTQ